MEIMTAANEEPFQRMTKNKSVLHAARSTRRIRNVRSQSSRTDKEHPPPRFPPPPTKRKDNLKLQPGGGTKWEQN